MATQRLSRHGIIANLIEYPAVAAGAARLRIQFQPQHTAEQIDRLANTIAQSLDEARGILGA